MSLKPHPFAELLPMASEAEYQSLKADVVATRKFREAAAVYEGKLLDGRNRYRVSRETGIKLPTFNFKGNDAEAVAYVYSRANRRNMSDSQKAAAAVNFLPHFEKFAISRLKTGASGKVPAGAGPVGESRDQAGALFGVSGRYVSDARLIKEKDPALFAQVLAGAQTVSRAKRLALRGERQRELKRKTAAGAVAYNEVDYPVLVGDCLQQMAQLPRRHYQLIFADPPYNLGFKYDADPTHDQLPAHKYLDWCRRWIKEGAELLTPNGTMCVMICEEWVAEFKPLLLNAGLHVRRLIVWHESFGQNGRTNFGRTCRYVWYAVKDPKRFVFDEGALLTHSKRDTVYQDGRAMPGGKVLDALWDFSRVCGTFDERIKDPGIPTQLPAAMLKRIVAGFTDPGDWVLDPFCGTGTTSRASLALGRRCVTIDRSKKYAAIARRELTLMNNVGKEA